MRATQLDEIKENEMDKAFSINKRYEMCTKFQSENLEGRDCLINGWITGTCKHRYLNLDKQELHNKYEEFNIKKKYLFEHNPTGSADYST